MSVVPSCANEQRRATVFLNEELKLKMRELSPPQCRVILFGRKDVILYFVFSKYIIQ